MYFGIRKYFNIPKYIPIFRYHLKRSLRIISITLPPAFIWRVLFSSRERNKIITGATSSRYFASGTTTSSFPIDTLKVGLMLPDLVKRSNILVESDIHFCYSQSLKEIGIQARSHTVTPTILSESPNLSNEDFVGEKKVDILIVDGNQFYSNNLNGLKMSLEQTKKSGTKVLVDLPDCYATKDGLQQIEFWEKISDVIVYHNPFVKSISSNSKLILWPGFPLPLADYYEEWSMKDNVLLMQGSTHRNRDTYLKAVSKARLPVMSRHHNRAMNAGLPTIYADYIEEIRKSRFVFTNGYLNSRESIIVGRAFETLASGSVLFYESGSKLSHFYSEYEDYIPVLNARDLVEKVSFLMRDQDTALRVANNAWNRTNQLYSPGEFWNCVLSRLQLL